MAAKVCSAPRTLREKLKFVGPGIVFAAFAIGSGELILTPRSGALYGYALLWVPIVTIIFKAAFSDGVARVTVATGNDIFVALGWLPGPKNWAKYFVMTIFTLEMLGYGGIALAAGTAIYGLFPQVSMQIAGLVILLVIPIILYKGSYNFFEKVVIIMSAVLVCGVVYSVLNIPTPMGDVAGGLIPNIPTGSVVTIMGLMGWVGAGTTTLLYSTWIKEKIGEARDKDEYKTWISTVRIDYVLSYSLILIISILFLMLGVYALHSHGLVPEKKDTMLTLSRMLKQVPNGKTVFLITAFFTLFSTVLAGVDGKSRAFASMLSSISHKFSNTLRTYRFVIVIYLVLMALAILFGKPVLMIRILAAVVSVTFGLLGFMLLYLDTKLPHYAKGSIAWRTIVTVGSLIFLGIGVFRLV